MLRHLYRCALRLHPASFRRRFGDEMLYIFDQHKGTVPAVGLTLDCVLSLLRQWTFRRDAGFEIIAAPLLRPAADHTPSFETLNSFRPRASAIINGAILSLILFCMTVFAIRYSWIRVLNVRIPEIGSNSTQPFGGGPTASSGVYDKQNTEPQQPTSESEQSVNTRQGAGPTLDASARHRIIEKAIASIKQHHIDPVEAHKAADALLAHERQGDDDSAINVAEFGLLATKQMREATGSSELVLLYSTHNIPERTPGPPPTPSTAYREEALRVNCAFERTEMLPHNVGYLKLNTFPDISVCQSIATAAMAKLNNADVLIFDLRDNRGGFPSMVSLLAAYLFDHPEYMYCPLENTTEESWTHSPVPGNRLANKPVYILTSSRTISAAEEFTYDLKMLKRATLVGETTAGGGHAANLHSIGDNFYVGTIEVHAINPYAKSDWNDAGVEPDFKVKAPDALKAALRIVDTRLNVK